MIGPTSQQLLIYLMTIFAALLGESLSSTPVFLCKSRALWNLAGDAPNWDVDIFDETELFLAGLI